MTPNDEPQVAPFTAEVSHGAQGLLSQLAYTWSHAEDGEQSGLLVFGAGEEPGSVLALWCDAWHQKAAKPLTGRADGPLVRLSCTYEGDWEWVIELDASDPDALRLRMDNVIPESAAAQGYPPGAYWAMRAELTRAASVR